MKSKEYWIEQLGYRWAMELKETLKSPYMEKLKNFLAIEYAMNKVYPNQKDIFNYFRLCRYEDLRMVIIVKEIGIDISAFPKNHHDSYFNTSYNANNSKIANCIYKEYYESQEKLMLDFDYTFENWAKQGVLFLPLSLTVRDNESNSHIKPWKQFIEAVINVTNTNLPGTVFLLWGEEAQSYSTKLSRFHHIFKWESPITAFKEKRDWNCPNFKAVDKLLIYLNKETIQW